MGHNEKEFSTKKIIIDTAITSNASAVIKVTNVAPAAVTTSVISGWLPVTIKEVEYFIPLWT